MPSQAAQEAQPSSATPEIRVQIWHYFLPVPPEQPALFHFDKDLLTVKRLTRSSPPYLLLLREQNNSDNSDATTPARPEKLDRPLKTPLTRINCESQQVALTWAIKQAPRVRNVMGAGLVQRFNPHQDALYISWNDWINVISPQLMQPRQQPLPMQPEWYTKRPDFKVSRYAMHQTMLLSIARGLPRPIPNFDKDGVLYIICTQEPPDNRSRYEIGPVFGGVYRWDASAKNFDFESDGTGLLDGCMQFPSSWGWGAHDNMTYRRRFEILLRCLTRNLSRAGSEADGYEVRPVETVEKVA